MSPSLWPQKRKLRNALKKRREHFIENSKSAPLKLATKAGRTAIVPPNLLDFGPIFALIHFSKSLKKKS